MSIESSPEFLDYLSTVMAGNTKSYSSTTIKKITKINDKPLISIPVDKLFELYGNLILAGFTEDEALVIVTGIAAHARGD